MTNKSQIILKWIQEYLNFIPLNSHVHKSIQSKKNFYVTNSVWPESINQWDSMENYSAKFN